MSYNSLLVIHFAHSVIVYICQSKLPVHPTLSPLFFPWYPYVCSLHLCLYFCFANKIIYHFSRFHCISLSYFTLDSLYVQSHLCKCHNFVPLRWLLFWGREEENVSLTLRSVPERAREAQAASSQQ